MEKPLWKFIDDQGSFRSKNADQFKNLYLPLCNTFPLMASISPDLHGDLKSDFDSFVLEPASRLSLKNSMSSRNFWVYFTPKKIWSATGVCKDPFGLAKYDNFSLEAGMLWQKTTRSNKKTGLKAEITSFIPASGEPVELMLVEFTNITQKAFSFTPTSAIPLYCRSANNLHDHRHVTSLLQRISVEKSGIIVTPALKFDEAGHRKNNISYFAFGVGENQEAPSFICPTQEDFTGEAYDLEMPEAIFKNRFTLNSNIQGKDAMAGFKFKRVLLKPKETSSYIVILGLIKERNHIPAIIEKFNQKDKIIQALKETKEYWLKKNSEIAVCSSNKDFDRWLRWVNTQPILRKIFGCSYLPDFDYGKGGRGWRDLWQDCLSLILNNAQEARTLLVNNFAGVRIDGSNATIIGEKPGEFIADRNNISRVWMDHGVWPLVTILLYIHQSGDINILSEECPYLASAVIARSDSDEAISKVIASLTSFARNDTGEVLARNDIKGTVLEHLLLENLIPFFNVGPHNYLRLENADWNDGLDMAAQHGESVAFSCMYAHNLKSLVQIIERLKNKELTLLKEITSLLDISSFKPIDYSNKDAKLQILKNYFSSIKNGVSGKRVSVDKNKLIADLKRKSEWLTAHIRENEWLKEGFFNGYYDNNQQRVEGKKGDGSIFPEFQEKKKNRTVPFLQMTLTGQVFPIMSGVATNKQVEEIIACARKYLWDKKCGGYRLNTDFKSQQPHLGRAFSFVYGEKENGAIFSHMCVMFAYALYTRGFAKEGFEVLSSLFKLATNTQKSKIYPCLPEYFNAEGRGMYSYLTGSASWYILTLVSQAFGVRGDWGNLLIEPKLTRAQFGIKKKISITTHFADREISVQFNNPRKIDYPDYHIVQVSLNNKILAGNLKETSFRIERARFLALTSASQLNTIEVSLE